MEKVDTLTPEEMTLRRRARRRLVGAVALALLAVVVLPMVFDPQPKPLGPDVDIRIPDQDTALQPMPAVVPQPATAEVQPQPPARATEGRAELEEAEKPAEKSAQKPVEKPAEKAVVKTAPKVVAPPAKPRPDTKLTAKTAEKTDAGAAARETKKAAGEQKAAAGKDYFLQLGVFSSETNAKQLAAKAKAAGFSVAVQGGAGQVRVRMGPYRTREEAVAMQGRLRDKGFSTVLVGP